MNSPITAEDLARQLADESPQLDSYYEALATGQPLRRACDQVLPSTPACDQAEAKRTTPSKSKKPVSRSVDTGRADRLENSYQSFLDEHAELAKQTTGMASGVWIDAAEFGGGNDDWPVAEDAQSARSEQSADS